MTTNPHLIPPKERFTRKAHTDTDHNAIDANDPEAIHEDVAAEISVITEKTVPIAADKALMEDSAASNAKKMFQLGNAAGLFKHISTVAATVAVSGYPVGMSYHFPSSDSSWPIATGSVETFIGQTGAGHRLWQICRGKTGIDEYIRYSSDGTSWDAWWTTWTDISSFSNSWVNYGGSYTVARYRKNPHGQVEIQGLIKDGTIGSKAFTLTSGFRPSGYLMFGTYSSTATVVPRLQVETTGDVLPVTGNNGFFSVCCTFGVN